MRRIVMVVLALAACSEKKDTPASQPSAQTTAPTAPAANPANPAVPAANPAVPAANPANPAAPGNPQDPAQALAKAFGALGQATQNPNAKAVNWRDILPLLTDGLGDWKASAPGSGESTAMGGFNITEAKRNYSKGTAVAHIKIVDTSMNQMLAAAFNMARMANVDASDHYQRGIDLAGNPGVEEWHQGSKHAKVSALIGGRFVVEADTNDAPDTKELVALVGKLDLAKLASLGK
jgi:hypothetical protein